MPLSARKFSVKFVSVLCLLIVSSSAQAYYYYSNDPKGSMFLKKPYGDMVNCGPLSALMLKKFSNKSSSFGNIRDAIETTRMDVQEQDKEDLSYRWWSIRDIKKYLKMEKIPYTEFDTKHFVGLENHSKKIVDSVTAGDVVVLNIDMNDLPKNAEIGKFYGTTRLFGRWGHFLLVVGYKQVNGQLAYEIHDSYSEKGKNRLFYAKDINRAITRYQKKLLIVKRNNDPKANTFDQFVQENKVAKVQTNESTKKDTVNQFVQKNDEPTEDVFAQYF